MKKTFPIATATLPIAVAVFLNLSPGVSQTLTLGPTPATAADVENFVKQKFAGTGIETLEAQFLGAPAAVGFWGGGTGPVGFADVADEVYDSGVFLKEGGFSSNATESCVVSNAGSFEIGPHIGQSNDWDGPQVFLCLNDSLFLDHNGDAVFFDPNPATQPGVAWAFYGCKPSIEGPTIDEILNDPCLNLNPPPANGVWLSKGEPGGDIWLRNMGMLQTFFNNGNPVSLFFAPVTIDDFDALSFETGGQEFVNAADAVEVVFLNAVQIFTVQTSGGAGSCTVVGGLPELDLNRTYASVSLQLVSNPAVKGQILTPMTNWKHGQTLTFNVPQAGVYWLTVEDEKSCGASIQITFNAGVPNGPSPCPPNQPNPGDDCTNACNFCGSLNGFVGSTANFSADNPPGGFCGTIENNQWMAFVAAGSSATVTVASINCASGDGVQLALYEGSCSGALVNCNVGSSGGAGIPVSITNGFVPGHTYYLLVDGFAGDQCDFYVTVDPPLFLASPPFVGQVDSIFGPETACAGQEIQFSVGQVSGAAAYVWEAPAGSKINGQTGSFLGQTNVVVTAGTSSGQVCVSPVNGCSVGQKTCKTLNVSTIPPTVFPPATICLENLPHLTPWGEEVFQSGVRELVLKTFAGCDSVLRQEVTVLENVFYLPTETLCTGTPLEICGQTIDAPGVFEVACGENPLGCDSIFRGSLLWYDVFAHILGSGDLVCAGDSVPLTAFPSNGAMTWFNASGEVLGTGQSVFVDKPGWYFLKIEENFWGSLCFDIDSIEVFQTGSGGPPPTASATASGIITCNQPFVTLAGVSDQSDVVFIWTGPLGGVNTGDSLTAYNTGTYFLEVRNSEGCSGFAEIEVLHDTEPPNFSLVSITDDQSGMGIGAIDIELEPTSPPSTVIWYLNGGLFHFSDSTDLTGLQTNNYTCVVTGPNGCTASATYFVQNFVSAPELEKTPPDWRLSPNPTRDKISLEWLGKSASPLANFHVFDAAGRLVLFENGTEKSRQVLDCRGLPPGFYALEIASVEVPGLVWRMRFGVFY